MTLLRSTPLAALASALLAAGLSAQGTPMTDHTAEGRAFVHRLATGDYAGAMASMDTTMQRLMSAGQLQAAWESLVAQAGAFGGELGATRKVAGLYEIISVRGNFARAKIDVDVAYDPAGRVGGLHFTPVTEAWVAPAYVTPAAFHVVDVTVGQGPLSLPATLTIPSGTGPFPAVVLVHGSGPGDRDETVGGAKVFRDLAEGLSSRGIAVLRYEKRTRAHGSAFAGRFTVEEETVADALLAVALLRGRAEIDHARIVVAGHSLGGYLAPRIGARDPRIAGLVVLAGNTRSLSDLIVEQSYYLGALPGADTAQAAALRAGMAQVARLTPADSASSELTFGAPPAYWLDLRGYHPAETARGLAMPMLILQGERDYQVRMTDFAGWRAALGGRQNVTLKSYPGLNHLFVSGTVPSTPAEYAAKAHVAPVVVEDIAAWISRLPSGPRP